MSENIEIVKGTSPGHLGDWPRYGVVIDRETLESLLAGDLFRKQVETEPGHYIWLDFQMGDDDV